MVPLADHVSTFVRASEALHWALLEGHSLTSEDRDLIQQTAVQLLLRVEGGANGLALPHSGKVWKRFDDQMEWDGHP